MKPKYLEDIIFAILIVLSSLTFILPLPVYWMDVLQSFAFHAMVAYGGLSVLLLIFKRLWLAGSALSACLLLFVFLHPYLIRESSQHITIKGKTLKVGHFNVLYVNRQFDKTIKKALHSNADILSFQEIDTAWAKQLEQHLGQKYPYYEVVPEDHTSHGLAVFSRYPLENIKIYCWSEMPNIAGDILFSGHTIHFLASHTLSPINPQRCRLRNQHLQEITKYLETLNGPVLAMGDYNTVPWNYHIGLLQKKACVYDSRKSFDSTFPAILHSVGIPIDYIFHSKEFQCINFQALPPDGSDHRGVLGVYRLAN